MIVVGGEALVDLVPAGADGAWRRAPACIDAERAHRLACCPKCEGPVGHGTYLQIRPKAAHGRARTEGIGGSGNVVQTLPRGFYLCAVFTEEILRTHYALPWLRELAARGGKG
ncbi:MAG: hypothetical protein ACHBMF_04755 [Chromatiales bacterium]